ncbi:MAG: KGK domain-containing protein [Cyanobacteriota bacterium]|nr:KGK domain-containing protein [Cyanobacteriota bacterium]
MNGNFVILESDDVVLLAEDTFKASKIEQIIKENIKEKLQRNIYEYNSFHPGASILDFFSSIPINNNKIDLAEVKYEYTKNCQVLRSSGQGWEKGQLKVEIRILPANNYENQIYLKFIPDEPIECEAFLDEIFQIVSDNPISERK